MRIAALFAVLAALLAYAYGGMFDNGFHFDDGANITDREPLHVRELNADSLWRAATSGLLRNRPLSNVSLALDWYRGGGDPAPFMQTNLLIHLLNTLLVFLLMRRIFRALPGRCFDATEAALLVAAVWSLHPIQVQAVTYAVQRMTSLATLFVLLSCLAYLAARASTGWRAYAAYTASALAFALGVLSKEIALITPVMMLVLELGVVRQRGEPLALTAVERIALAVPVALFVLVSILYVTGVDAFSFIGSYEARDYTVSQRLITQPRVFFFHAGQMALPYYGLFSIEHDLAYSASLVSPWTTVPALLGFATAAGACAYWFVTRRSLRAALALWFLAGLVIEGSIVPLEIIFEHRMYLPSIGLLACGVLWAAPHLRRGASLAYARYGAVAVVLAFMSWNTSQLVDVWRDNVSLYEHAIRVSPDSARAHNNLGRAYWAAQDKERAVAQYERAVALDPDFTIAMHNLARAYQSTGRRAEAARVYERLLQFEPANPDILYSLGIFYLESGQLATAERYFGWTLHYQPNHSQARMFLDYCRRQAKRDPGTP